MARIIVIKLEIPADDDARVEEVKAHLRGAIHKLGNLTTATDADAGQPTLLERTAFFAATTVKLWVNQGERKKVAKA